VSTKLEYDIEGIILSDIGQHVKSFEPMQKLSCVYAVETEEGKVVMKVAEQEHMKSGIRNEIAINMMIQHKVPVPRILSAGFNDGYIIMEDAGPDNFYDLWKKKKAPDELFAEMGRILHEIHSFTFDKPGKFKDGLLADLSASYSTAAVKNGKAAVHKLKEHIDDSLNHSIEALFEEGYDDSDDDACLLHFDYHPGQIIVSDEPHCITGVIDFEIGHVGPPLIDLVRVERFMLGQGPDKRDQFFQGYPKPPNYESKKRLFLVVELLVFAMVCQQVKDVRGMYKYLHWVPRFVHPD